MGYDTSGGRTFRDLMTPVRTTVLVLSVLALVFIFQNQHDVRIRLLIPVVTMPLWGALLIPFVIGVLAGLCMRRSRRRRR